MRLLLALVAVSLGGCAATTPLPREAVALNTRGAEALAAGHLDDAEARFRLALEYSPRFSEPRANLGLVAMERGDLKGAEADLRGAIDLNEDFAEAWGDLGVVLERQGRPGDARAAYERALSIQPGLVDPRRNLSRLLIRRGDLASARAQLMRLVQIVGDDPDAQALLAYVELRSDRPRAALRRLAPVLQAHPDHPVALMVRGAARARLGDLCGAVADLTAASSDPAVGRQARVRLAAVELLRGDRLAARKVLGPLLAETPRDPAAQLVLCRLDPSSEGCPEVP